MTETFNPTSYLIDLENNAATVLKLSKKKLASLIATADDELKTAAAGRDIEAHGIDMKLTRLDQEQAEVLRTFNQRREEIRAQIAANEEQYQRKKLEIETSLIRDEDAYQTIIDTQQAVLDKIHPDKEETSFTVIENQQFIQNRNP